MPQDDLRDGHVPVINAPTIVIVVMGSLVAAHGLRLLLPEGAQFRVLFEGALVPARMAAMLAGSQDPDAYSILSLIQALFGHVFLHGDWMHVILNAAMGLALGAPVARILGSGRFLLVFFGAAFTGAAVYFALVPATGPPAIGASGGVSGLLAAALLCLPQTGGRVLSKSFILASLGFFIANVILSLAGPSLIGMGIAWQAHLGGFAGGALLFRLFRPRAALAGRRDM